MNEREALDTMLQDMSQIGLRMVGMAKGLQDDKRALFSQYDRIVKVVGKLLDETPVQASRPDYCSTISNENLDELRAAWDQLPLTMRLRVAAGHMTPDEVKEAKGMERLVQET